MEWNDVEKLGLWVINKYFGGNIDDLRAETYLCYLHCKEHYQPEYSNFSTYYRTSLIGWIKDYLTYNSNLVHIPRMKQDAQLFPVSSLSQPVSNNDDTLTLLDMIEDAGEEYDAEDKETAIWLSRIDDIYNKLSKTEQRAVPYFKRFVVEGIAIPREYRTQAVVIRKHLLEYK